MKKMTITIMSLVVITFAGFAFSDLDSINAVPAQGTVVAQNTMEDMQATSFQKTMQWWL